MLPKTMDDLAKDFEYQELPTKTFKLNVSNQTISGFADNLEAMMQAIYLILNTERYEYLIYSWNYGVELQELYGKDMSYVLPELKRRISEALLQDSRILSVEDFNFESKKGKVIAQFKVLTTFGEIQTEKVVNV